MIHADAYTRIAKLAACATLTRELDGWSYRHSRDLTGFEDGTENPPLDEAGAIVAVPDGSPGAGSSVLLVQQWRHEIAAWQGLSVDAQEKVIGRTKGNYDIARKLMKQIAAIPGAVDVHIHQEIAYPTMDVNVDRTKARQIGLAQQDVALDKLFIDVAEFNERVMSGAHIESLTDLAIRTALTTRGVAHLTIPVDVQVQQIKKGRSERNPVHHTSAVPAYFEQVPARVELEHPI